VAAPTPEPGELLPRGLVHKPPYVKFGLFFALLDQLQRDGGTDILGAVEGLAIASASAKSELVGALRALDLVDNTMCPTPTLLRLARQRAARPELLRELLRRHFGPALDLFASGAAR